MSMKTPFAAVLALVVLPAAASAQQLDNATVDVTATVLPYAEITGTGDVVFGDLSRSVDNTIDSRGGVGAATRNLAFNGDVEVTFSSVSTALVGPNGATLPVVLRCANYAAGAWSAEEVCTGVTWGIDNLTGGTLSVTLGIGGTILAADVATRPAGAYSGSLEIVVTAR